MANIIFWLLCALFVLSALTNGTPVGHSRRDDGAGVTASDAESAYYQLQSWYDKNTGLWAPSAGWWNSANCLTTIANLAAIDSRVKWDALSVFTNTFAKAPQYNTGMSAGKAIGTDWLPKTWYTKGSAGPVKRDAGFLDGYYDDEGWWALAWIAAYDISANARYLAEAETIFRDMNATFGQTNCSRSSSSNDAAVVVGGIWWDKNHTYVNAIANELHLSVAANLAKRTSGSQAASYLATAKQQWAWFRASGMLDAETNTINDGLDQRSCRNNGGTVWSYNQGVILDGLVALSQAATASSSSGSRRRDNDEDDEYISTAQRIADAAMTHLAPDGILHDPCEPDCGADGTQFKGVFARNLQSLWQAKPLDRYRQFLQKNAQSILAHDAQGHAYSVNWAGPFVAPANASTHSSAMDAVVGALATNAS